MGAEIAKLGHVAAVTPDIEKSLYFFKDVVGLEEVDCDGDTVFLKAWGEFEHHSLSLRPGSEGIVEHIGWRTHKAEDVDQFAEQLEKRGTQIEWIEVGQEKGQGKAFRFRIPGGQPFEIYFETDKSLPKAERRSRLKNNTYHVWDHGISPRRIDHVNIHTDDPMPSHRWLQEELNFKMREYIQLDDGSVRSGWLSVTPLVHDVAIGSHWAGKPNRFHHVAYYLDNFQDVIRGADILREKGLTIDSGPGRHGISQAFYLYFRDPASGLRVELFSGGYIILDPDWEPIKWEQHELEEGLTWWGQAPTDRMKSTTPCVPLGYSLTPAALTKLRL